MIEYIPQGLFILLLFMMGLTCLGLFRSSLDITTIGLLSFPTGAALWVIYSTIILISGIPFTSVTMLASSILWLFTASFIIYLKKEFNKSDFAVLAVIACVFVAILGSYLYSSKVIITSDSWTYISMGKVLTGNAGFPTPPTRLWMSDYGFFVGLIFAGASFLEFDYVHTYMPIISLWFILIFGWLLFNAQRKYLAPMWAGLFSVLAILIYASTYFIIFQSFYIHANLTASVYFTLAVISLWFYITDRKVVWLVLETLFVISFALSRTEGPLFALLILLATISAKEIFYKQVVGCITAFTLVIAFWNYKLLSASGFVYNDSFSSPSRLWLVILAVTGFWVFAIFSKCSWITRIKSHLPLITHYILALLALLFTFSTEPAIAQAHFQGILSAMFVTGSWEGTWLLVFVLLGYSLVLKPLTTESLYVNIIIHYLVAYYIILYKVGICSLKNISSVNRMLFHIFPTIIFYLFLKYAYNFPWRTNDK